MANLEDIIDFTLFEKELDEKWICARQSPLYPELSVCSYTPDTQYACHWNDVTRLSRGLVLKNEKPGVITAKSNVVARGITKFFTLEAHGNLKLVDDDEGVDVADDVELDMNTPVVVSDKLDGCLIIAFFYDGKWNVATKGSFTSPEGLIAQRIINESKEAQEALNEIRALIGEDCTPLFELITPEHRHVVNYSDYEGLTFLGYVNNKSGIWFPACIDYEVLECAKLAFRIPEKLSNDKTTLGDAIVMHEREDAEGVVITTLESKQKMFKVKYSTFLKIREVRYGITTGGAKYDVIFKVDCDKLLSDDANEAISETINSLYGELAGNPTGDYALGLFSKIIEGETAPVRNEWAELAEWIEEEHWKGVDLDDRESKKRYAALVDESGLNGRAKSLAYYLPSFEANGKLDIPNAKKSFLKMWYKGRANNYE